ncbi:MAG: hypothetical protein WKF59_05375 [Chitinophagaceae bacterium]
MKTEQLFFAIVLLTSITSCSSNRYMYSASPPNPYFKEKGESKLAAYYSSSNDNATTKEFAGGWDLQGAYAISDHWALTASYFNRREQDVYNYMYSNPFDSSVVKYKRNLFEIGGGYFLSLNQKNHNR